MFENNDAISSNKSLDFEAAAANPLKPIENNQATEEKSDAQSENEKGVDPQGGQSQATDSAVTDEKLFMQSTGFGEPKHTTDDFTNSPKHTVIVPVLQDPNNIASTITSDQESTNQQLEAFFSKRNSSQHSQGASKLDVAKQEENFKPAASAGFKKEDSSSLENNAQGQPKHSRTLTNLNGTPSKTQLLPPTTSKGVKTPVTRIGRHRNNSEAKLNNGQLPSLVKQSALGISNSATNFAGSPSATPLRIGKKSLQTRSNMMHAYGRTSMTHFIEKGAFGGAMQEIMQDQVNAQTEGHGDFVAFDDDNVKKARRRQRLNQILTAASKGRHTVKPSIELEEIAHQYHNLKISHNRVQGENTKMKARLNKLNQQVEKKDEKIMRLSVEMIRQKTEQANADPLSIVEHLRHQGLATAPPGQPNLFTSVLSAQQSSAKKDPAMAKVEQSSLVISLKKQVNEMRNKNEKLQKDIEDLQKSTKVCVFNELDVQLEAYTDECTRMRAALEKFGMKDIEQRREIQALRRKLIKKQKQEKKQKEDDQKIEEQPSLEEEQDDEDAENGIKEEEGLSLNNQVDTLKDEDVDEAEEGNDDNVAKSDKKSEGQGEGEDDRDEKLDKSQNYEMDQDSEKSVQAELKVNEDGTLAYENAEMASKEFKDSNKQKQSENSDGDKDSDPGVDNDDDNDSDGDDAQSKDGKDSDEDDHQDSKGDKTTQSQKTKVIDTTLDSQDTEKITLQPMFKKASAKANQKGPKSPLRESKSPLRSQEKSSPKKKKPDSGGAGVKPRTASLVKRLSAMNDNVRNKNLQITDLNRKLKIQTETFQKEKKLLAVKNWELAKTLKQLETENTALKEQAETEEEDKQSKKKAGKKQPSKAKKSVKKKKEDEPLVEEVDEQKKDDGDAKDDQSEENYSDDNDHMNDDVDTLKKSSRILSAAKPPQIGKDKDEESDAGGYTSVEDGDDQDPVAQEAERQFQESIKSDRQSTGEKNGSETNPKDDDDQRDQSIIASEKSGKIDDDNDVVPFQIASDGEYQKMGVTQDDKISNESEIAKEVDDASIKGSDKNNDFILPSDKSIKSDRPDALQTVAQLSKAASNSEGGFKTEAEKANSSNREVAKGNDEDEDEVIDITERLFVRIAEQLIKKDIRSGKDVFRNELFEKEIEGQMIELITPIDFLKRIQSLGIDDLDDEEKKSLLQVLTKPELDGNIVMSELLEIMKNLGLEMTPSNPKVAKGNDDEDEKLTQQKPDLPQSEDCKSQVSKRSVRSAIQGGKDGKKSLSKLSSANESEVQIQPMTQNDQLDEIKANMKATAAKNDQAAAQKPKKHSTGNLTETVPLNLKDANSNFAKGEDKEDEAVEVESAKQDNSKDESDPEADGMRDGEKSPYKSVKSENLLKAMTAEKNSLEGQSLGRHDDSMLTNENANVEEQEEKQISEEEMLDTAEKVLRKLAEQLLENEWSVKDVFDHPKLVHFIPSYEDAENVKALSAQHFLGRLYQMGFQDISQVQVVCVLRVLGKFDLDNAIIFDDLQTLLENYGVNCGDKGGENVEASFNNLPEEVSILKEQSTVPKDAPQVKKVPSNQSVEKPEKSDPAKVPAAPQSVQQPNQEKADDPAAKSEVETKQELPMNEQQVEESKNVAQTNNPAQEEEVKESVAKPETTADSPLSGALKMQTTETNMTMTSNQTGEESKRVVSSSVKSESVKRKATRKDSILRKLNDSNGIGAQVFEKIKDKILLSQDSLDSLIDMFKAKSYKQNIKSKSRQSETLVIQKVAFFEIINSLLSGDRNIDSSSGNVVSTDEMDYIEGLVLLTPKIKSMYAMRHIENLFQTLFSLKNSESQQTNKLSDGGESAAYHDGQSTGYQPR